MDSKLIPPKSGMYIPTKGYLGCVDTLPWMTNPGISPQCQVFAFVTARRHRES